ncbi:MAG: hypothetical protein RMK74_05420 [Myxococcales bacterium]|nr:hypothetical protein [Myxococcales bacterium]
MSCLIHVRSIAACLLGVLAAGGCLSRDLAPLNPCTISNVNERISVTNIDKVDVLFMVDNSNSMAEEQDSLSDQFPRLVRVLTSGDRNGDGLQDFQPARSLHIGVISSDMGTGGFRVPTCNESNFGDDGRLRDWGRRRSDCPAMPRTGRYETFLDYTPDINPDDAARDVTCIAAMGTGGCGFEQQLEAVLKAITPASSPLRFQMGTTGHADGANAGFLRPDSVLALILVTDEEDCSFADPELGNPNSTVYPGDLNLRCFSYPHAAHPISRYVDGYLAARANVPDLLVYAAITGVPVDLVDSPGEGDEPSELDRILADESMIETIDPAMPTRLKPSCNVPGRGIAFPPRRIVQVAKELMLRGAGAVVQSICQADYGPALDLIIDKIADALGGACLPRDLNPDATGRVPCDVIELLPMTGDFTRCEQLPGREAIGIDDETGRALCRVIQRVPVGGTPPTEPGWYYDTFTPERAMNCGEDGQRIAYTEGARPPTGAEVRLECLQPAQAGGGVFIDVGSPCEGRAGCSAGEIVSGGRMCVRNLTCNSATNELVVGCSVDADCEAEGLRGFRCDTSGPTGFCVNPTC